MFDEILDYIAWASVAVAFLVVLLTVASFAWDLIKLGL